MAKGMIITIGTGPSVSHGICYSIKNQNPDIIKFIVTAESEEKTMPIIQKDLPRANKDEIIKIRDSEDIEKIARRIKTVIKSFSLDPSDIVIDFTSGTKSMSAGAAIAGIQYRVGGLVYVTGDRDSKGIVISGSERILTIKPNRLYAQAIFNKVRVLFNEFQYEAARKMIPELKKLYCAEDYFAKLAVIEQLIDAYDSWDKFDLETAFSVMDRLKKNEEILREFQIKTIFDHNKQILFFEKTSVLNKERIVDLLENAARRGLEGKYDDGVARLYRLYECIAQCRICELGLYKINNTGSPETDNIDINKLPPSLRKQYEDLRDSKNSKIKLALHEDYQLLKELGDELGIRFMENHRLRELLGIRNRSILAHGFNPIGRKIYEELFQNAEKLAEFLISDLKELRRRVRFPHIKEIDITD